MINIAYNKFNVTNLERQKELDYCLEQLTRVKLIKLIVIDDNMDESYYYNLNGKQTKILKTSSYFKELDSITKEDDINIIINSDCWLDEQNILKIMNYNFRKDEAWCLTRRDVISLTPFISRLKPTMGDSHDLWAYVGKSKPMSMDWPFGALGTDNRLAYEFKKAGYKLRNPCFNLAVNHLHLTELRFRDFEKFRYNGSITNCDNNPLNIRVTIDDTFVPPEIL